MESHSSLDFLVGPKEEKERVKLGIKLREPASKDSLLRAVERRPIGKTKGGSVIIEADGVSAANNGLKWLACRSKDRSQTVVSCTCVYLARDNQ